MIIAPPNGQTWYQVLDIQEDASEATIRSARRRLQRVHHPDLGGDGERSRLINLAHDVLTDPWTRRAYDRELRARRFTPDPSPDEDSASHFEYAPSPAADTHSRGMEGPWLLDLLPRASRRWTLLVNALAVLVIGVSAALVIVADGQAAWPLPPALSAAALLLTCATFAWCGSLMQFSHRPTGATALTVAAALSAALAATGTVLVGP